MSRSPLEDLCSLARAQLRERIRSCRCDGQLSRDPSLLPNSTLLYYGRLLKTGVSAIEASYVDYIDRKVFAGFVTSQDAENYARIAIFKEMICFNLHHNAIAGSRIRIPGLFTMLGGPAFGPNALVKLLKHYNWGKVVIYFQNAPEEGITSETFASMALLEGIEFDMIKRESPGAVKKDLKDLDAANSNIFIFFGGSLQPVD